MKTILPSLITAIISSAPGVCGVERVSVDQNGQTIAFYAPIANAPTGFSIDQVESVAQHKRVFIQNGYSVSSSKILLFSEAILKSEIPNIYTIDHFISERLKVLKTSDPSTSTIGLKGINTGDGTPLNTLLISSEAHDDMRITAYQEDGKYYVVFEAIFKQKKDIVPALQAFQTLLNSYHVNTN
jgi:hypothetical protein